MPVMTMWCEMICGYCYGSAVIRNKQQLILEIFIFHLNLRLKKSTEHFFCHIFFIEQITNKLIVLFCVFFFSLFGSFNDTKLDVLVMINNYNKISSMLFHQDTVKRNVGIYYILIYVTCFYYLKWNDTGQLCWQ